MHLKGGDVDLWRNSKIARAPNALAEKINLAGELWRPGSNTVLSVSLAENCLCGERARSGGAEQAGADVSPRLCVWDAERLGAQQAGDRRPQDVRITDLGTLAAP
jgi:hypothetical protein